MLILCLIVSIVCIIFCSLLRPSLNIVFKVSDSDSVTQTEGSVITPQGDLVRLNCTYQFSLAANVDPFWYVQFPSQKGFNATHYKKDKSFHLWKQSSDLSDSGTYYCAARDTVTLTSRGTVQKPNSFLLSPAPCPPLTPTKLPLPFRQYH
uniref:Ig-like domain-containing protein n=1 Tax=Gopherus agassizii TaxID=38772 RepID=A0A452HKZ4_9SAUR